MDTTQPEVAVDEEMARIRERRQRQQLRHAHALLALLDSREDLRGVHRLADVVEESVRWSA